MTQSEPKFELGRLSVTPNAQEALTNDEIVTALSRHERGDWGDVGVEDSQENEYSLLSGFRIFSVYHTVDGKTFWVITEADRSATTVLLPEDY